MSNSNKAAKLKKSVGAFIFSSVIFLLLSNSFSTGINLQVHDTQLRWKKEYKAIIDGRVSDCAWAGGMELCKPTLVDIDADGDLDMFIGGEDGRISFFRNDGTKDQPRWSFISDFYDSIEVGEKSSPFFADIDDDRDFDLFVGDAEGMIVFYQNDGDSSFPQWGKITENYESIDVGEKSVPFLVDIDADFDLDLFIGGKEGVINFYRNEGTEEAPIWNLVTESYNSIDIGAGSNPHFVDIDSDDDFDLFIGEDYGNINFYRNIGNPNSAEWDLITSNYNSINVGRYSFPAFVDIDNDSDFDLFIGQKEGKIYLYRNHGNPWLPDWNFVTENFSFIDLGSYTKPALADIDDDGDFDLFVGEEEGNINFYRNEATLPIPSWTLVTENYYAIEAEDHSHPTFADIDSDGDLDLFIGKDDGQIEFYQNIGSSHSASWILVTDNYHSIDVGRYSSPTFVDIDADYDLDFFIGQENGKISFYRNDGTPQEPSWTPVSENYNSFYVGKYSVPLLCDLDSDGDPDLYTGEAEGGLHFYKNLTLNSIRGRVTDNENNPVPDDSVYLSGDRDDTTSTDSLGNYQFIGLPVGNYCVFRDQGTFQYCFTPLDSDTFEINFGEATDVGEEVDTFSLSPKTYHLYQNYPNPFNPATIIPFHIEVQNSKFKVHSSRLATLKVYNILGQLVKTLVDEKKAPGSHNVIWDGKDEDGNQVASGIYFYQLRIKDYCDTKKMILVK